MRADSWNYVCNYVATHMSSALRACWKPSAPKISVNRSLDHVVKAVNVPLMLLIVGLFGVFGIIGIAEAVLREPVTE